MRQRDSHLWRCGERLGELRAVSSDRTLEANRPNTNWLQGEIKVYWPESQVWLITTSSSNWKDKRRCVPKLRDAKSNVGGMAGCLPPRVSGAKASLRLTLCVSQSHPQKKQLLRENILQRRASCPPSGKSRSRKVLTGSLNIERVRGLCLVHCKRARQEITQH